MTMSPSPLLRCLGLMAALALPLPALAAPAYVARPVTDPEGNMLWGNTLDDQARIAGRTHGSKFPLDAHAMFRSASRYEETAVADAAYSEALGASRLGDMAGYAQYDGHSHAWVKRPGQAAQMLFPEELNTTAYGVNSAGTVVGDAPSDHKAAQAFAWKDGVVTWLGTLGGPFSYALAINDAGVIVGEAQTRRSGRLAFRYEDGRMRALTPLVGALLALDSARAVNAHGVVAGHSSDAAGFPVAVVWHGITPSSLGTLPGGSTSAAAGINDAGIVVGNAGTASGADHAFVWQDGVMTDLNDVVDLPDGVVLSGAGAINNRGQILAYGKGQNDFNRVYVLDPL
jgi:probable HAF family extracellular repeat protein